MTPTKQEMLDAINMKIARTHQSDEGTWHFLPVMIGDILDWVEVNKIHEKLISQIPRGKTFTSPYEMIRVLWKTKREPLDKQSDDCISYIYNLLTND